MYDTKIQTPISSKVLTKAKSRAEKSGFSSINDVIRIIVNQFAEGQINFSISLTGNSRNIPFVDDEEQKEIEEILNKVKAKGDDVIVATDIVDI